MNKKTAPKENLLKLAEQARELMLEALVAMPKTAGCELLLRKNIRTPWVNAPTDDEFSVFYRTAAREAIEEACELGLCLLEYNAMSTGENMGVAYKAEIEPFLATVPKKGKSKAFSGDKGAFSSLKQRCVRINAPGGHEVLAFGPAGISPIAALKGSNVFALFEQNKIVKPAESGFLHLGRKVTFFVFKDYVFVVDAKSFASATDFREVVKKRAQQAIKRLKKLKFLKIGNFEALQDLCNSSPDFANRISASDARGFFDNFTREGLLETMEGFAITFDHSDDGKVVTLNPDFSIVAEKREFQKLMTQVFVRCAVTGRPMEALKLIPHDS